MACGKFHKASKGNWFTRAWDRTKRFFGGAARKTQELVESGKLQDALDTGRRVFDTGTRAYNQAKDFAKERGWNTDNKFTRFVDGAIDRTDKGLNTLQSGYDHIAPMVAGHP